MLYTYYIHMKTLGVIKQCNGGAPVFQSHLPLKTRSTPTILAHTAKENRANFNFTIRAHKEAQKVFDFFSHPRISQLGKLN